MDTQDHLEHDRLFEASIAENVTQYGFHVCLLESEGYGPPFAYTIGLFKTFGHPELIVFGLSTDMMAYLLEEAAKEISAGKSFLPQHPYPDFLEDQDVRFQQVAPDNASDYMGYAGWFYKYDWSFPVLQLVWPDHDGLFPWDADCDPRLKRVQPMLKEVRSYKFYEPGDTIAFTTTQVLKGSPIVYASHDDDGSWQFHAAGEPDPDDALVVSLGQMAALDPTLNQLFDLQFGMCAQRKEVGGKWTIGPAEPEE